MERNFSNRKNEKKIKLKEWIYDKQQKSNGELNTLQFKTNANNQNTNKKLKHYFKIIIMKIFLFCLHWQINVLVVLYLK